MHAVYKYISSVSLQGHTLELRDLIACHENLFCSFVSGVIVTAGEVQDHDFDSLKFDFDVSKLFFQISKLSVLFKDSLLDEYIHLFDIALSGAVIRQSFGVHPRLRVLGQMEARSMHGDVIIMAGLNEGVWPNVDSVDPWMSRTMQQQFGLPTSDQYLSLSAHDFVQAFCQGEVMITRSTRIGSDIAVPSRWLSKFHVLADIAGLDIRTLQCSDVQIWADLFSQKDMDISFSRPIFSPPIAVRPHRMSVTEIDKLIQDPYGIYAKHVLKLKKLPAFSDDEEARLRGIIIHNALEKFNKNYGDRIPEKAPDILLDYAHAEFEKSYGDDPIWMYWQHQFLDAFISYLRHEKLWRADYKIAGLEQSGQVVLDGDGYQFTLRGRFDRIDVKYGDDHACALIDYKTSQTFNKKDISDLRSAQLPLEAMMIERGGIKNLSDMAADYMGYWIVKSGSEAMQKIAIQGEACQDIAAEAEARLMGLMDYYLNDGGAYVCLPNAMNLPRYNDYAHLSRVPEWSNEASADE